MNNPEKTQAADSFHLTGEVFVPIFEAKGHIYRDLNGNILPSVTQIIKPITDQYYQKIDRALLREAARVGTAVHKAIEKRIAGKLDESTLDAAVRPYIAAFDEWGAKYTPSIMVPEMKLACATFSGTMDCLCYIDHDWWVIDWKTTQDLLPSVGLQTAAYAMLTSAWMEQKGCTVRTMRRGALQLKEDGTYCFKEYTDPEDFEIFNHLLAVKRWMMSLKALKE